MSKLKRKKIIIDATSQSPGRLASKIAFILTGKHKPGYVGYLDSGDKVEIRNVDKIFFSGKKLNQKIYRHHTMYPGGLKEVGAKKIFSENPSKIVVLAVKKMLPKNKFRTNRLKRLSFSQ